MKHTRRAILTLSVFILPIAPSYAESPSESRVGFNGLYLGMPLEEARSWHRNLCFLKTSRNDPTEGIVPVKRADSMFTNGAGIQVPDSLEGCTDGRWSSVKEIGYHWTGDPTEQRIVKIQISFRGAGNYERILEALDSRYAEATYRLANPSTEGPDSIVWLLGEQLFTYDEAKQKFGPSLPGSFEFAFDASQTLPFAAYQTLIRIFWLASSNATIVDLVDNDYMLQTFLARSRQEQDQPIGEF